MYNTNNYGYNPYGTYMPQRTMQQPIQQIQQPTETNPVMNGQRPVLSGKPVDSIEMAKMTEYQLDGSVSYYPLTDGSAIVTKQLQMDGTSKIVVFKPTTNEVKETPKYLVKDDLDDLKDEINDIKQELKELKKIKKKKDDDNE